MANLSTLSPASTYQDLLNLDANGQGLQTYPVQVQDGLGNLTNISISKSAINFDRGIAAFQLDGVPLTASANTLNNVASTINAQYLLATPNTDLPNSAVLTSSPGIQLVASAGTYTLTPVGELGGLQSINGTGFVSRTTTGTYTTRAWATDGTLSITNPDGVNGNPTLSVIPDTSVQRTIVQNNGVYQSARSTLNFIAGDNVGIVINDDPGNNSVNITVSATPGSIAGLIQGTPNQIDVTQVGQVSIVSLATDVIIDNSVSAGNLRLSSNTLSSIDINGDINITPDGIGRTSINSEVGIVDGTAAAPSYSFISDPQTGFYTLGAGSTVFSSSGTDSLLLDGTSVKILKNNFLEFYDATNTHYVAFTAGPLTTTTVWTLPLQDSVGVQALVSDGAGNLSWATAAGGVASITGTTNQIDASAATGDVTLSISTTYPGQASITTLGTISAGVWNGTGITVPYGGTGLASTTPYALICGGTTSTGALQSLSSVGTTGQILKSNGAGALPSWEDDTGGVTSVLGTLNQIDVSSATGDVTISISPTYIGQTSITTLGTISAGTWNGATVSVLYGGTGITSATPYSVICGGTTSTGALQTVTSLGTAGQVLTSNGAGNLPTWQNAVGNVTSVNGTANQIDVSSNTGNVTIAIAGTYTGQNSITTLGTISSGTWNGTGITVPYGGTGLATTTPYALICGGTTATGVLQQIVGLGTSGQILTSNGAGTLPTWQNPAGVTSITGTAARITATASTGAITLDIASTYVGQTSITTLGTITSGTWNGNGITVPYGGTGVTTTTPYAVICGGTTATGALQQVASVGTSGQVLTSNGAGALPTWQNAGGGTITGAKAWVLFDGTIAGTNTPTASYNVTSVTTVSTGTYTINFTAAMSTANYAAVFGHQVPVGSTVNTTFISSSTAPTTTALNIIVAGSSFYNTARVCAAVFSN